MVESPSVSAPKSHWPISILSTLSSFASMALPLILVRVLDADALGSFKIFFLYLTVLPPLTLIAGVSNGLAYWAGRGEEGNRAIRSSGLLFLLISVAAWGFLVAFGGPLTHHLHLPAHWSSLFAVALALGIASLFYDDAAIATGRIWTGALFNSGFEFFRAAIIVVVALRTRSLFAIVEAHIAVQTLRVMLGYFLAHRQRLVEFSWNSQAMTQVVRYAFPVSIAFVFGLWLNYSDQIILSKTISTAEFAVYSVCCLTVPPLLVLEASVTRVLIPQLSEAFAADRSERAARLYRNAVGELAFFLIPAAIGMIVFAAPIIELLFTKNYLSGTPYLRLYSLWYLTLLIPADSLARARGDARWIFGNFVTFALLTVALCAVLGKVFGAMGALSGLVIARVASRAYTVDWARRRLGWRISEFVPLRSMLRMTALGVGLGVLSLATRPLFGSQIAWLFGAGSAFTIAYLVAAARFFREPNAEAHGVLMLTPGLFIGGLERMILNLSRSLKDSSAWRPSVYAYDFARTPGAPDDLVSAFETHAIPVRASAKPPRFSPRTVARIAAEARRSGSKVIHTHDLGALIYGALAKCLLFGRVRLVHTQHSFVHLNRSPRYRFYEKFFTRFADAIVTVSPDTRDQYLELGLRTGRVRVIENGVDFPNAPTLERSEILRRRENLLRSTTNSRLAESRADFWILYLARIHPRKGQDHALRLWAALDPEIRRRSVLLFVGPETETGELARLREWIARAPDADRVIEVGPSHEPEAWIQAADLFLSSSEFEGMPLSPLEAVGSGVPAVLSRIAGHDFLGPYAALYPLSDPEEGARAIQAAFALLDHDPNVYRFTLWKRTEALRRSFTLATMSKRYAELYGVT